MTADSNAQERKAGKYQDHPCTRFFPLVGPDNCDCTKIAKTALANAYEFRVPPGYIQTEVTFEAAKRNCYALGALKVRKPKGGAHYHVTFPDARTWRLDPKDDPVPETYLRQLMGLTGLPFEVITYTLREGKLPPRKLRFAT